MQLPQLRAPCIPAVLDCDKAKAIIPNILSPSKQLQKWHREKEMSMKMKADYGTEVHRVLGFMERLEKLERSKRYGLGDGEMG